MGKIEQDIIATTVHVRDRIVYLDLVDGSTHSFPALYYPRLAQAEPEQLKQVTLRVGGRALRWEELDEDIWVTDAVCQNYPKAEATAVAEPYAKYGHEEKAKILKT